MAALRPVWGRAPSPVQAEQSSAAARAKVTLGFAMEFNAKPICAAVIARRWARQNPATQTLQASLLKSSSCEVPTLIPSDVAVAAGSQPV